MYDTIIIGSGPAGMSSAIYLKNANKNVVVFEKDVPGGKILKAKKINNYLGLNNKEPSEISYEMYNQLIDLDIKVMMEKVVDVVQDNNIITVITNKNEYKTKTLLISCGRIEKSLDIENKSNLEINGISYCAKCDGALYKNKKVAIVADDPMSIEEAKYLSKIACEVYYLNYSENDIDFNEENIFVINNKIKNLNEEGNKLVSITLDNEKILNINGLFVLNGYAPNTEFIKKLGIEEKDGYIIVSKDMKTNKENIYAAGDIIKKDLYQIITAASEGAVAAANIIKSLNK